MSIPDWEPPCGNVDGLERLFSVATLSLSVARISFPLVFILTLSILFLVFLERKRSNASNKVKSLAYGAVKIAMLSFFCVVLRPKMMKFMI